MPLYTHDCKNCKYLGSEKINEQPADIYFCKTNNPIPTMIARFGDEGHDYSSCDILTLMKTEFKEEMSTLQMLKWYYLTVL